MKIFILMYSRFVHSKDLIDSYEVKAKTDMLCHQLVGIYITNYY